MLSKKKRDILKNKYGGRCAYCGEVLGTKWHADHLKPLSRISKYVRNKGFVATGECHHPENDNEENLMPACISCNIHKGNLPLEAWRGILNRFPVTLKKSLNYSIYRHAHRFGLVMETGKSVIFHFETYIKEEKKCRRRLV